jgi:hypothetical protein
MAECPMQQRRYLRMAIPTAPAPPVRSIQPKRLWSFRRQQDESFQPRGLSGDRQSMSHATYSARLDTIDSGDGCYRNGQ